MTLTLVATVGLRRLFLLTLIPGIAAALLIAFLVREKPHEPQAHLRLWSGVQGLPASFKRYLIGIGLAGIGDFSKTLLILWATLAWTPRLGAAGAAQRAMLFYIGYNVLYTLSCYLSGSLADRYPKRWVLAGGYSLAVIPALALLCFLVGAKLNLAFGHVWVSVLAALACGGAIWLVGRRWFGLALLIVLALLVILAEDLPADLWPDSGKPDRKTARRLKLEQAIAKREALLQSIKGP